MTSRAHRKPVPVTAELREHAAVNPPLLPRPDQTIRVTNMGVTPK